MRTITITVEHEWLFQEIQAEAAKEGRPIDDVIEEAFHNWLDGRSTLRTESRARRATALALSDRLRLRQAKADAETSIEMLDRLRDERS